MGSRIDFKRIHLQNFMSYSRLDLEFTPGLKVLQGPIGSGKTSILSGILFALYGQGDRGKKTSVINDRAKKNCLVSLELEVNGIPVVIERGLKPNRFDLYIGEEKVPSGSERDLQGILETRVLKGISRRIFHNLLALSIDKGLSFFQMNPKERGEFLNFFLDFSVSEIVKERIEKFLSEVQGKIRDLDVEQGRILGLEEALSREYKDKKEVLESLRSKLSILSSKVESLHEMKDQLVGLKSELEGLRASERELRERESYISGVLGSLRQEVRTLNEELSKYDGLDALSDLCQEEVKGHLRPRVEDRISELKEKIRELEETKSSLSAELSELKRRQGDIETQVARLESELEELGSLIGRVEGIKNSIKELEDRLVEIPREIEKLQGNRRKVLLDLENLRKLQSFWSGVSRSIQKDLREALLSLLSPKLLAAANSFLNDLGFPFRLSESGDISKDMVLRDLVTGSDRPYFQLSTGQRRLVDFSFLLSFHEVLRWLKGMETSILFLDEFFGSLDQDYLHDVLDLLREQAEEDDKTIIVTSHTPVDDLKGVEFWKVSLGSHTGGFSELEVCSAS